jgi:hypothetical protein
METATGESASSKRARFDATAQNGNERQSPLTLTIGHIRSHTEALHTEIQDITNKIGNEYLKLRQRVDLKHQRILKMSSDDDYILKSARFAFELKVCDDACQDAGYATLVNESRDIVEQCKKDHYASTVDPSKPFSVFYIMPKIHKNPLAVRPVVSYSGSLLYGLGVWCDDKLQRIARIQRSYFKSSFDLLQELKTRVIPPNAKLFTADATAMYTNILIGPTLHIISKYLQDNEEKCVGVPRKALFDALSIVMRNNNSTFGDTTSHQDDGAAMGAPPSPSWATMFFPPP